MACWNTDQPQVKRKAEPHPHSSMMTVVLEGAQYKTSFHYGSKVHVTHKCRCQIQNQEIFHQSGAQ